MKLARLAAVFIIQIYTVKGAPALGQIIDNASAAVATYASSVAAFAANNAVSSMMNQMNAAQAPPQATGNNVKPAATTTSAAGANAGQPNAQQMASATISFLSVFSAMQAMQSAAAKTP